MLRSLRGSRSASKHWGDSMIRTNTLTDGSVTVDLDTEADWSEFAADNHDAIREEYGSERHAFKLLKASGWLNLGGGASPLVCVYMAEQAS